MDFKKALRNANILLGKSMETLDVVLLAQVVEPRGHDNPLQLNCSDTEHFTEAEYKEIYQGIINAGFYIKQVFFSEIEFLQDVVVAPDKYENTIVMNLCRNGAGMNKKAAVPAICDLLGIRYTSSGSGQCAIARNKWMFSSFLSAHGIKSPASSLGGRELHGKLPGSTKVICKPNNKAASQGVDEEGIIELEEAIFRYGEDMLIQEYIDGYECEVPIFCCAGHCFAMPPVGILFSPDEYTGILSYTSALTDDYDFYQLDSKLPEDICMHIMADAVRSFKLLGMEKYGRIDFRIDKDSHEHYVIDIATTPYITNHSSFAYAVQACDGEYTDIFRLIISAAAGY